MVIPFEEQLPLYGVGFVAGIIFTIIILVIYLVYSFEYHGTGEVDKK